MTFFSQNTTAEFNPVSSHDNYQPHIDGLRAIAVSMVVLFHAFPHRFTGGFSGVDIFFVISGYLISTIILSSIRENKFSIVDFYKKRINRIFPSLIVVLLASISVGAIILFKDEQVNLDKNVFFSTTFLSNIYLLFTSSYFDSASEKNPLLHLWSLGVEEQFYILWPLLLLFLAKKSFRFGITLLGLIVLSSFFLNVYYVNINQSHTFYFPLTRFWELGIGSICAYCLHRFSAKDISGLLAVNNKFLPDITAFVGLSLIVIAQFSLDGSSLFPGWGALWPVVGTSLMIVAGKKSKLNQYLLSNSLVIFIGMISYPLYLWHWPIFSFFHIDQGPIPRETKLLLILLSLTLAILTYYAIEKPLRFSVKSKNKAWFLLSVLLGISIYALTHWYVLTHTKSSAQDQFVSKYVHYTELNNYTYLNRLDCSLVSGDGTLKSKVSEDCFDAHGGPSVWIWGDSFAMHLYSGLKKRLPKSNVLLQTASYGCMPSFSSKRDELTEGCAQANKRTVELIGKVKPDVVVLAQRKDYDKNHWPETVSMLKQLGVKHVIVVGPAPQWNQYLYRVIASNYINTSWPHYSTQGLITEFLELDRTLKKQFESIDDAKYLSLIDLLCRGGKECLTYIKSGHSNGEPELTTFDYGHLTLSASDCVASNLIAPAILESLGANAK